MKIKTLYKEGDKILQRLTIRVGDCYMTMYREIGIDENGDFGVNEVKEPPIWWIRYKKLKALGI
jgi:hypothetical protein